MKKRNEPESCDLKRDGTKRNTRALENNTERSETERYEIERNTTEHSCNYAEKEWNEIERFRTEQNETDHRHADRIMERTGKNRKLYFQNPFRSVSFRFVPFRSGIKKCCPPLITIPSLQ